MCDPWSQTLYKNRDALSGGGGDGPSRVQQTQIAAAREFEASNQEVLSEGGTLDPSDPRNHGLSAATLSQLYGDIPGMTKAKAESNRPPSRTITRTERIGKSNTYVKKQYLNPAYVEWSKQFGASNRVQRRAKKDGLTLYQG